MVLGVVTVYRISSVHIFRSLNSGTYRLRCARAKSACLLDSPEEPDSLGGPSDKALCGSIPSGINDAMSCKKFMHVLFCLSYLREEASARC